MRWLRFYFAFENGLSLALVENCQKFQSLHGLIAREDPQCVCSPPPSSDFVWHGDNTTKHRL